MPRCIVCGRFFHEGQGIVIRVRGGVLEFHSSRCAAKFFRRLVEENPEDCIVSTIRRLADEYNVVLREAGERVKKRI